jgi:hypothetical protein
LSATIIIASRLLDRGAQELALVRFEFAFEAFEQGEGIRSRAGETADDAAVAEAADFPRVGFHDGLAHRDLAVADDDDLAAAADR